MVRCPRRDWLLQDFRGPVQLLIVGNMDVPCMVRLGSGPARSASFAACIAGTNESGKTSWKALFCCNSCAGVFWVDVDAGARTCIDKVIWERSLRLAVLLSVEQRLWLKRPVVLPL